MGAFALLTTIALCWFTACKGERETYDEELIILPSFSNFVLGNFRFRITLPTETIPNDTSATTYVDIYEIIPKVMIDLLKQYHVQEFHLTLTQGVWRGSNFDHPSILPEPSGPTGAQLWAWFSDDMVDRSVDDQWKDLVHSLSGMFCASLIQMVPSYTVNPKLSFKPYGLLSFAADSDHAAYLRYASLPNENVCTENITPWKKLLPCRMSSGLSSLLNPIELVSAHYLSLGVHVKRFCVEKASNSEHCSVPGIELLLTATSLFQKPMNIPWSLQEIFGSKVHRHCCLATSSNIYVSSYQGGSDHDSFLETGIEPKASEILQIRNRSYAKYSLPDVMNSANLTTLNLRFERRNLPESASTVKNFSVHSYLGGSGQQFGRIITRVINRLDGPRPIAYLHTIPWYFRIYFHSLNILCSNRKSIQPEYSNFQPANNRLRPSLVEFVAILPPASDCEISLDFDKQLLRWTEYPPDAHHGFAIPAAVVSTVVHDFGEFSIPITSFDGLLDSVAGSGDEGTEKRRFARIYGESLLVAMPTPDFSMPYNVICLVCTVVALAFGPIHNLTTKRLVLKSASEVEQKTIKAKLKQFAQRLMSKLRQKFSKATVVHEHSD